MANKIKKINQHANYTLIFIFERIYTLAYTGKIKKINQHAKCWDIYFACQYIRWALHLNPKYNINEL